MVSPCQNVEPALRDADTPIKRPGELAGDRADRVGIVGEIDRENQRVGEIFRALDAPQRGFERVDDIAGG